MFKVDVITPTTDLPVTVATTKLWVRTNNGTVEDDLLTEMIDAARLKFESLTGRFILPTVVRQYFDRFNNRCGDRNPDIFLLIPDVTALGSLKYYDVNDTLQSITDYGSDLSGMPARIWITTLPSHRTNQGPIGYVQYTAGIAATTTAIPNDIKVAVRQLATHWYENRAAYSTDDLKEVPLGFKAVCWKYSSGIQGGWGNG